MELQEFIEKFLPDYEAKERTYYMSKSCLVNADEFYEKHFPEALKNFTDKICELQRVNCMNEFQDKIISYHDANFKATTMAIVDAEQPEIENL